VIVRENDEDDGDNENLSESYPTFECMGYDDVDLVLVPHIATVFIKSEDAGMTEAERLQKESQEQEDRIAEISIDVFEKGLKKRRRKKKKKTEEEEVE
jgi:hypothetical protein